MKIRLEGNRVVASLEDEGKSLSLEAVLGLRYADGKILPVLAFAKPPEGQEKIAASVQKRVLRLLGVVHVAPWGKRVFPLTLGEATTVDGAQDAHSLGRMRSLPKLPRL